MTRERCSLAGHQTDSGLDEERGRRAVHRNRDRTKYKKKKIRTFVGSTPSLNMPPLRSIIGLAALEQGSSVMGFILRHSSANVKIRSTNDVIRLGVQQNSIRLIDKSEKIMNLVWESDGTQETLSSPARRKRGEQSAGDPMARPRAAGRATGSRTAQLLED